MAPLDTEKSPAADPGRWAMRLSTGLLPRRRSLKTNIYVDAKRLHLAVRHDYPFIYLVGGTGLEPVIMAL